VVAAASQADKACLHRHEHAPFHGGAAGTRRRRCFRAVDFISDTEPKFVAIDEKTNYQVVHRRCCRKADCATHEPLDACPQVDVCTFDFLRVLLADYVLLWVNVPLVCSPPIGIKLCNPKWL
jgi:hypothetical protein